MDGLGEPSSQVQQKKVQPQPGKGVLCETMSDKSDVNIVKNDNMYMFLCTPRFKFLDVRNYFAPSLGHND